ncbi:MAG: glycosyltransferase family 39 protein [Zoogloeaceae bacterium]|jgi:4-amino-4-deoxy-L-arabinose transferase-like glycosyltransferase|nr:glycosyltransferase family 39 protein [Zoogloeaceae bacterium]
MTVRTRFIAGLLALALIWFGTLDYRKLVRPDEGRYAEIPREMALSGDWVTPRLNGLKYFEKPPLQYWATTAAFKIFGPAEWTARLWPALTGFLGILLAGFTARRLFGPTAALYAVTILSSSLLYLAMAQINAVDMGMCFFLEAAVCGFLLAQGGNRRWMLAAWAGLALAVLSKGIVALVLTGGTLILYSILSRDWSPWRRFEWARGLPLFLLIAVPWFIAVSLANPEFPRFFFIHEHFERFLTTVHRRYQPFWFFVPLLLLGALPWTGMALQALRQAWTRRTETEFQARRFLLIWCLVVFGFFSISSSKLPAYILPLFPALALLLADYLPRMPQRALLGHLGLLALVALTGLLLSPIIADGADEITPPEMVVPYARVAAFSAAIWLAGILTAFWLVWRQRRTPAMLTLAAASLLAGLGILLGHNNLNQSSSAHFIASQVKPLLTPEASFYSVGVYDQTLPFYLGRTITLVRYRDEFALGQDQEPDKWIPTEAEFRQRWLADRDAFAFVEPDTYEDLRRSGFPMVEAARDTRRVIIRKPQP